MKTKIRILLLASALAFGCGEESSTTSEGSDEVVEPTVEEPTIDAPAEAVDALPTSADFEEEASEAIDADNLGEEVSKLEAALALEMGDDAEEEAVTE